MQVEILVNGSGSGMVNPNYVSPSLYGVSMEFISKKMLKILLVIALPILATGCAGKIVKLDESTNFGPVPENHQETIKAYFAKNLNNPEKADYVFSEPMKFYRSKQSLAGLGGGVQWTAWVVEVGIPGKAVYKFISGWDEELVHYYVRFDGNEISDVYEREVYKTLKEKEGFTVGTYESIDEIKFSPKAVIKRKVNKTEVSHFQVIRELHELYKEGIITEEEFTKKKRAILDLQ